MFNVTFNNISVIL